jgi:hypothetical protein
MPIHHHRGHLIVTVREDVSFNYNRFASRALDGKSPAVDARRDILDDDPDLVGAHGFCALTLE